MSPPLSPGITRREFARREGCDPKLVRRAIELGRLQANPDGSLDPALIGTGWRLGNRHPPQGGDTPGDSLSPPVPTLSPPVPTPPPAPHGVVTEREPQPHGGELQRRRAPPSGDGEVVQLDVFERDLLAGNAPTVARSEQVKAAAAALKGMTQARQAIGAVIDVEAAEAVFFEDARAARDSWMNWPARAAPRMAAELGIDAQRLIEVLTRHVQLQLEALGDPQPDFEARRGG